MAASLIPLRERFLMALNPVVDKENGRTLKDYWLALIHCQHNARVIGDFEVRMSRVIYEATGGQMSKPYYALDAMIAEIRDHQQNEWNDAYLDGQREADLAPE